MLDCGRDETADLTILKKIEFGLQVTISSHRTVTDTYHQCKTIALIMQEYGNFRSFPQPLHVNLYIKKGLHSVEIL